MPDGRIELAMLRGGARHVAGIDEVGRGAWAGPVSVGVAVVDEASISAMPDGLRDSKLLSPGRRQALFPLVVAACVSYAVGHASPSECDELGMTAAQRLAALRAIRQLPTPPDALVVDGTVEFTGHRGAVAVVGADRSCVAVAAASVLAKVTRDRLVVDLDLVHPGYGLASNKGYPTPEHRRAVERLGLSEIHRRSWRVERAPGGRFGPSRGDAGPARL